MFLWAADMSGLMMACLKPWLIGRQSLWKLGARKICQVVIVRRASRGRKVKDQADFFMFGNGKERINSEVGKRG